MPEHDEPEPRVPAESRLRGMRPLSIDDEDDRPSREDKAYGETIFNRSPVPLPRFLTGRRKPKRR